MLCREIISSFQESYKTCKYIVWVTTRVVYVKGVTTWFIKGFNTNAPQHSLDGYPSECFSHPAQLNRNHTHTTDTVNITFMSATCEIWIKWGQSWKHQSSLTSNSPIPFPSFRSRQLAKLPQIILCNELISFLQTFQHHQFSPPEDGGSMFFQNVRTFNNYMV
jgi:hypothetical protein